MAVFIGLLDAIVGLGNGGPSESCGNRRRSSSLPPSFHIPRAKIKIILIWVQFKSILHLQDANYHQSRFQDI